MPQKNNRQELFGVFQNRTTTTRRARRARRKFVVYVVSSWFIFLCEPAHPH